MFVPGINPRTIKFNIVDTPLIPMFATRYSTRKLLISQYSFISAYAKVYGLEKNIKKGYNAGSN